MCIHAVIVNKGFTQCLVEQALYYNCKKAKGIYEMLYVDYMLIPGDLDSIKDMAHTLNLHSKLNKCTKCPNLWELNLS